MEEIKIETKSRAFVLKQLIILSIQFDLLCLKVFKYKFNK